MVCLENRIELDELIVDNYFDDVRNLKEMPNFDD
jgi:hypothetical protein